MEKQSEPLIAVDLTRFGCAALVMAYHFLTTRWLEPTAEAATLLSGLSPPSIAVIASGRFLWVGVQVFFVISGMVIAQSAQNVRPAIFLQRRILRLAPGVIVCSTGTMLALTFAGLGSPALLVRLLRSSLLWPFGQQIDPSYWTLGIELSFYALVAVMVRGKGSVAVERTALLLAAWSGAFWFIMACDGAVDRPSNIDLFRNLAQFSYGCFFALGMLFTVVARRGIDSRRAVAIVVAVAGCCMQIRWKAAERSIVLPLPCEADAPILIFFVAIAILAVSWKAQPALARLVTLRVARAVGLATYPLYLLHQEAGTVLIARLMRAHVGPLPAIAFTMVAATIVAWIVAAKLEPVVRSFLAFLLKVTGRHVADLRWRGVPAQS